MARKQVVEVECSRCSRVEKREPSEDVGGSMSFEARLSNGLPATQKGTEQLVIRLEDLCAPCYKTVRSHLEAIGKRIEKLSPNRKVAPKVVADIVRTGPIGHQGSGLGHEARKKGQTQSA